tara:strand:+ start:919 stop:1437 length:519 start_codon:yes stop_codon:yes gene_type:complete
MVEGTVKSIYDKLLIVSVLMLLVPLTVNSATAYVSDEKCAEEFDLAEGEVCTKAQKCSIEFGRTCNDWELGETAFTKNPLGTMLQPFDHIFQGMSLVIFWGLLLGILWLRTENPMLVGMIGVVMVSAYSYAVDPTMQSPEFETARWTGGILLVISVGISLYQLFGRLYAPPQ